jgi:tripartite ATP-independent transporter DctM subunit
MDSQFLPILVFGLLFLLLALGMPIGFAMGLSAFLGTLMLINTNAALGLLGQTAYETGLAYNLSVVPMFVLMGFIAGAAGLSESLYRSCNAWLGHRRGGLALATIGGCGAFAAICGSSLATAATMSQIALPEMRRYKYDDRLATGAVAAGGTIGILIPPSVLMVIYGLLTETSISRLFLAGVVPGILTVIAFMITIAIMTRIDPTLGPPGPRSSVREKLLAIRDVWGTALLFIVVIGGIYGGVFSPTEAASIGAVGALALAIVNGRFSSTMLIETLMNTVKTTAMIFTVLIGAILFNNFLILSGLPNTISAWMSGLPLGDTGILLVILLFYLVLGCVLDSLAMVLLTIPIVFPIIQALGFDPIWFGIIVVMVVELGLITPPIGMNVFVIKGIARDVPLESIFRGVLPFVAAQIVLIAILIAFPQIALWLPSTMGR